MVLFGTANRDETVFPEPDSFQPGRANNHLLGFGRGIHACVGAALARMEARVVLNTSPGDSRTWHSTPTSRPLRCPASLMHRGPRELHVLWG